jgi:hypothetical protein
MSVSGTLIRAIEDLGEYAADDDDQLEQAADSGVETRRPFSHPLHR